MKFLVYRQSGGIRMVRNQLVSQIDQAVESLTDELTEFACTIFGIPTQNPPGNNYRQCAEAIGAMMQKIGMDVEYVRCRRSVFPSWLLGARDFLALAWWGT